MNDWYNIGILPGILGDLIGDGDDQLDGNHRETDENSTRPPKGGDGNPLAPEEPPDIIKIEEDGQMYIFDRDGNYITDFSMDEYGEDGFLRTPETDYRVKPGAVQVPDGQIYYDENDDLIYERWGDYEEPQSSTSTMTPARDADGNLVYIDSNGNIIYPEEDDDEYGEVGEAIPEPEVQYSAPMTDYAGNTFFMDEDGDYVDINGNPYEPVLSPPTVNVYYDELGNLWDEDGNLVKPAPENDSSNGTSNPGITDELGNDVLDENNRPSNNDSSNNGQQNNNNSGITDETTVPEIRDEMGDPIPGISGGDNIINEPDELDSEDEDYIPTTREPVKYDKPTNYNSTIGSRAAYYAP